MAARTSRELLEAAGVEATPIRLLVLELLAGTADAMPAPEILKRVLATLTVNKVTLYRTLDLLVEKGLLWRHSGGDRAFRYCLPASPEHPEHGHFYCRSCGRMQCLSREEAPIDLSAVRRLTGLVIDDADLRFDGVCASCLHAPREGRGGSRD